MKEIVAVLGATGQKGKFANKAIRLLKEKGYEVVPVNPLYNEVEDLHCFSKLEEVQTKIDTITVYVNPQRALDYSREIISVKPRRVILNPGTENVILSERLAEAGITVIQDCTLIMLRSEKF